MVTQQSLTDATHPATRTAGAKRGEVLVFRQRVVRSAELLAPPPSLRPSAASAPALIITRAGRDFVVTAAMADCFLARVHRVVDAGESALVPLLHAEGVDLLLISATTPLRVRIQENQ